MSNEMWVEDYPVNGTNYTGCYSMSTQQVADIPENTCGGEILKNVLESLQAVDVQAVHGPLGDRDHRVGPQLVAGRAVGRRVGTVGEHVGDRDEVDEGGSRFRYQPRSPRFIQ